MKRALVALWLSGCWSVGGEFTCGDKRQCNANGQNGQCVDGNCAYFDRGCASQLKWDELARADRAGMCTPAADMATIDEGLASYDLSLDLSMPELGPLDLALDFGPLDLAMLDLTDAATTLDSSTPLDFRVPYDMTDGATPLDMTPPCPKPWLLMLAEDFGTTSPAGTIFRFSIAGGALAECPGPRWTGSGQLDPRSVTLAPLSGTLVATASWSPSVGHLQILDTSVDQVTQGAALAQPYAIDVAPIVDKTTSATLAAVGSSAASTVTDIETFDPSNGARTQHWTVSGFGFGGSDAYGMTYSPLDARHLFLGQPLATGSPGSAAVDEDPWQPAASNYATNNTAQAFVSLYSIKVGALHRTAWIQNKPTSSFDDTVFYLDETNATQPVSSQPTLTCPLTGATMLNCGIIHAVPDPTATGAVFALCDPAGSNYGWKYILRYGATCTKVWDGKAAGLPMNTGLYPIRLAVWQ